MGCAVPRRLWLRPCGVGGSPGCALWQLCSAADHRGASAVKCVRRLGLRPQHLHLLPSLLSPQTSYPLISLCLCRSIPSNRPAPSIFTCSLKRKLRLPLFDPSDTSICPCGHHLDPSGDHIFQCTCLCKIGAHNSIRDGFATLSLPHYSLQQYLLPTSNQNLMSNHS